MWARIDNITVAEITDIDPTGRFHPAIEWVACPAGTEPGWRYDGETFTPPSPIDIDELATQQHAAIESSRDAAFDAGMEYDFPGGITDVVQTRPHDKANLLGLAIEARDLLDAGVSEAVVDFRAQSNITYTLTPQQAVNMTNSALRHVKKIYERSWLRKDDIKKLLEEKDRESLEKLVW